MSAQKKEEVQIFESAFTDELMRRAAQARKNAYSPYSGQKVGAAVLGASGEIYSAGNIENGCYALTICAERAALYQGVSQGEKAFVALAVTAGSDEIIAPCGACRQVLWELAGEIMVVMFDKKNKRKIASLADLYPMAYKKKSQGRLRKHKENR